MQKKVVISMVVLLIGLLAACNTENDNQTAEELDSEVEKEGTSQGLKSLEVDFEVPAKADVNQSVELMATVTYGEEKVKDADKVVFKYWNENSEEDTTEVEATNNKDGTYSAEVSFANNGIYEVHAGTTAQEMDSINEKKIAVGDDVDKSGIMETDLSQEVKDFEFTTQDKKTLALEDLKGQWWVADMVFTNCTTVCLPMTSNMSKLQDQMNEEDLNAQLVSFSVDPEHDTPEVLKEYGESYQADFSNWTFLTGYDFKTIKKLSMESFQSALEKPEEGSDQVTHGTSFFLINPEGEVVKRYDGVDSKEIDELVRDLKLVLE